MYKIDEIKERITNISNKYQISSEYHYLVKAKCPQCEKYNWLIINDSNLLNDNLQICKCYSCKQEFWINEKIKNIYQSNSIVNEAYLEIKKNQMMI